MAEPGRTVDAFDSDRRRDWEQATDLYQHGEEDPLKALKITLACTSRDTSESKDIAWMYGIVCGWSEEALGELRTRFGWPVEQTDRLKRLHTAYEKLVETSCGS